MDRRTNGPEGSGGASPTVVTSRAGDDTDNDVGNDDEPDISVDTADLEQVEPGDAADEAGEDGE